MTVAAPTALAPAREVGGWRRYAARWPRAGKEVLAIVALFFTAVVGFTVGWTLFALGIGLVPLFFIGVFIAAAAGMYVGRGVGAVDLALLEWTGLPSIRRATWASAPGLVGFFRMLFGSIRYWATLAYVLAPQLIVAVVSFTVLVVCLGLGLGGVSWPLWGWLLGGRAGTNNGGLEWLLRQWLGGDQRVLEGVLYVVIGVAVLVVLPFVTRGLVWLHWGVARALLGARTEEALRAELSEAQESRAAAVAAEDSAVRRIERDIHDGPQQRLIRLQLDLASAGRRMGDDPEAARELIASAAQQAHDALEELRAVALGIAPPILLDRGLVAALESVADRNPVPARVDSGIPADVELSPELERNAYFIAHEALANATKYAQGTRIDVRVVAENGVLLIEVTDDGIGGAAPRPGHGLAGLSDRARGFGGRLELASPAGGGTRVTATLPITDAAGRTPVGG
ncbi:sensor histidine kinase [Gryllotalpicola daejeonensis]|uniref:histidine kinase n=1 Tax=Gryllotalpicola daejeonensis TaxID=993087 RepID=A0ABP7ZM59_9MICO